MSRSSVSGQQLAELPHFLELVHNQVDTALVARASEPYPNNGSLVRPAAPENLQGCESNINGIDLGDMNPLLPFDSDQRIAVRAVQYYGINQGFFQIEFKESSRDKRTPIVASYAFKNGALEDSFKNTIKSPRGERILTEDGLKVVMDAAFADNPDYNQAANNSLSPYACLVHAISMSPKRFTGEFAEKQLHTKHHAPELPPARLGLEVEVIDRHHPNRRPSKTTITLDRQLDPKYCGDDLQGVRLEQRLRIVQNPNDTVRPPTYEAVFKYDNGTAFPVHLLGRIPLGFRSRLNEPAPSIIKLARRVTLGVVMPSLFFVHPICTEKLDT